MFFAYGDVKFEKLVQQVSSVEWRGERGECRVESVEFASAVPSGEGMAAANSKLYTLNSTLATQNSTLSPQNPTLSTLNSTLIQLNRATHQAHVMLGTRAYAYHHPRRMALYLLNNVLGGPGMNAQLNLSLRERHGLVYTVESSMASYADTGLWAVYFGCDPNDVQRCLRLVRRCLNRFMEKPLSATRLAAAKRQLKGQLAIACDNHEQFALDCAKSYLHHGTERDLEQLFARIDAVTATDILDVAKELFDPQHLVTLVYTNHVLKT